MSDRPILFSAPMVRALLAGTKSQTRRAVKPQFSADAQPSEMGATNEQGHQITGHSGLWWDDTAGNPEEAVRCPYGQPGELLWVKETYFAFGRWETRFNVEKARDEWHFVDLTFETGRAYLFAEPAGWKRVPRAEGGPMPAWWKRPALFIPRVASRITLAVSDVRVEKLQEISEADVIAEGCPSEILYGRGWYRDLWAQINGPGSWDSNPWVWVVTFRQV